MFDRIGNWLKSQFSAPLSDEEFQRQRREILQKTPVPVIWLFGKTGSGKSSLVRFLTGSDEVTIGTGFRPETGQSARYSFPSQSQPLLQFIDTRGLGESGYDPAEDIARFHDEAHLLLLSVRVLDNALEALLRPLHAIRRSKPTRPVLLVLTCLHEAYPGRQHPQPDPFLDAAIPAGWNERLAVALRQQQHRFEKLVDDVVPVDLTLPEDGFDERHFGGERLKEAIIHLLPEIYRQSFCTLQEVLSSLKDLHQRRAMPYVLSCASMSGSAAAVPVPWIDLPVVAAIQSEMIRRISRIYNQPMDLPQFLTMAGAVGGPALLRQFFRETLKVIPGVGSAANAALAFATTYALGKACCWYFGEVLAGHVPSSLELRQMMSREINLAQTLWQKHQPAERGR